MAEPEATASHSNHQHHDEEEDEILHEIPVYLSTKLAQNLYLFQYPLRVLPFAPGTGPAAARIKPKSQLIEVDLPIDTRAPTYDKGRGDDFASGVTGEKFRTVFDQEDEDDYSGRPKKRTLLDKQTLGSTLIPTKTKYLVGVLKDKELHVTPLTNTVQMRPTLSYIDKSDEKERASAKRAQQEETKEEQSKSAGKAQTVQMSVINAENESTPRKNMYSMATRNADDEEWVKLEYFDETTVAADAMYGDLFATNKESLVPTSTSESYADSISPVFCDISS
ncbi:hypothetical protein K450DRAFT_243346 [Umbelopsis ramanniana AG]|uniref:Uncharacterized protein n=1 Tax=Umbelopsis ramanniana AG TaxID=1314678 RepID=A0AAD5EA85_UMBRA|nr:uncharacterized protein K450DRAFT_243346 [Umbelopsis ramanniana AG]KAI8579221.1 hypothetical protein K450DRAFT_243346 [Umbelopsis ramanniana AG]